MSKIKDFWISTKPRPLIERFHEKYMPITETGCWIWLGGVNTSGYGQIKKSRARQNTPAHRISWELHRGEIPQGMFVCHKCDIRSCVNPDHLFLGTAKDNSQDMKNKGRSTAGERDGNARLTEAQVIAIRASDLSDRVVADEFGISRRHANQLRNRVRWEHVG